MPDKVTRRLPIAEAAHHPAYVVWELTLACDQPCTHCGSRAGDARAHELTTEKALDVVNELAAMGTREVVLIGGEAYLHPGFLAILRAIHAAKIRPTMTTGGHGITAELATAMADAGMYSVSVSIDGLASTHDLMRANRGSYDRAMAALGHLSRAGLVITANTNVNRLNSGDLEALYEALKVAGIASWQVQVTAPLGRAADRADLLLQPYDYIDLMPRIAALKTRAFADGILLMPGNNLGYFGPEEADLRSVTPGGEDHFHGCLAGRFVLGIESDGAVKGCPSLQTKHYVGGNVSTQTIEAVWNESPELAFTRRDRTEELWGFCASCPYASVCQGGCTFTAQSILGRRGNNPYCSFRARDFQRRGLRERIVPIVRAEGLPFDNGTFALVVEPFDAPDSRPDRPIDLVRIRRAKDGPSIGEAPQRS